MYNDVDDNIKLDKEQIKAILCDEDYSLIIAGAGTGKTTTMAAKVKYLVDIKRVNLKEILVMSIHKSKGLTYDEVIIIGLDRDFPINERSNFWLEDLFKPKDNEENFRNAEERRVFYVALTRTKNHVFLLVNNDASCRSSFVEEIYQIVKKDL